MRSYRKFIAWLAIFAALASAQQPTPTALFNGRDLHKVPKGVGDASSRYGEINPSRSLLLSDCAGATSWCSDPQFSFATIFAKMATLGGIPRNDAAAQPWYAQASTLPLVTDQLKPWDGTSLKNNPFQLLAVVNRMDLANWINDKWSGAEIRFVYGPKPPPGSASPPLFTLILEFVLPDLPKDEFYNLANSWFNVKNPLDTASGLPKVFTTAKLENALLGRLRLNHASTNGPDPWQMAEWDFIRSLPASDCPAAQEAPTPNTMQRALLRDELRDDLTSDEMKNMWKSHEARSAGICLPYSLFANVVTVTIDNTMPTPLGICGDDPTDKKKRKILALQQCRYCHSSETGTSFQHIQNRMPEASAKVSGFLTGDSSGVVPSSLPSIDDLSKPYLPKQNPIPPPGRFAAKVTFNTFDGAPACSTAKSHTSYRSFNDLERRGLFLDAVLLSNNASNYSEWVKTNVIPFRTNFAH